MLQRRSQLFRSGLVAGDIAIVSASWGLSAGSLDPVAWLPALGIAPLWVAASRAHALYRPRRLDSPFRDLTDVIQAGSVVLVLLVAFAFFSRSEVLTREALLFFWPLATAGSTVLHVGARKLVRVVHRSGRYMRPVLVVGSGRVAEELIDRVTRHPEIGVRIVGVIADDLETKRVGGIPVIGTSDRIKPILQLSGADEVMLALPQDEYAKVKEILSKLDDELVDVRLVPDLLQIFTLRASVEDLDGLPMIGLRQSPLVGWPAVQKRCLDIAVSGALLCLFAPFMLLIAAVIAFSSGRPIFYRQVRVGIDGREFYMTKFRTMIRDAEQATGPIWARSHDIRETGAGRILRRWSLDELPQLWNVFRGDMSLVGPRPERPYFIERFRKEVPGYMLRHKVKAGLTGWAQVHRWRGDTSLEERIEHDLYYIQNWSMALDIRILMMTLWRSRNH